MRELTYAEALREALRTCLIEDERVVVLGEDIGCYGGIFQITKDATGSGCIHQDLL